MKIFVTGATGFVGTHLVRRLAQTDHQLCCLVRGNSRTSELEQLGVNLVTGDVTDRDSVRQGMEGCDWVFNLANIYTLWEPNKRKYTEVNVDGTRNVMESALETGVSKVVHVSTYLVYGKPADCPFTEESPIGPVRITEYGRTKYEGDLVAWALSERKGLPLVMIYPGNILGVGDTKPTGQFLVNLIRGRLPARVFNNTVLTYVNVADVAEAILRAAEKEGNIGQKYIVASERYSMREVYQMTSEISGARTPRFSLPDSAVMGMAAFLTLVANITKRPPMLGLSMDMARIMKAGLQANGSKVVMELGMNYTPVRAALEEYISSLRE